MGNNTLILPRKDEDGNYYISYSQLSKWKRGKRDYIRKYFFNEPDDNPALQKYGDFGHQVGESFENKDFSSWTKYEAKFLQNLPHYDEYEREIRLQMDGFYVLGYIDTNTKVEDGYVKKLADYKTGEIHKRADEYKSDDYEQVHIYAAALGQQFGKLPDEGSVVLIGRSGNAFAGEDLKLTGEVEVIEKVIDEASIKRVLRSVQKTAEEISLYYQTYLNLSK